MDIGSVGGLLFALLIIIFVGMQPQNIPLFIDIPSMGIVIGGTLGAIFICFPLKNVTGIAGVIKYVFLPQAIDQVGTIQTIVSFSEQARREGILALESRLEEIKDEFLRKGIQLAVDGTDPQLIKDILNTEVGFIEDRHAGHVEMISGIGDLAPAYGMVGTLVGLVLMLANMADPAAIGPAMAVALITTLYGALVANLLFIPFSIKLKGLSAKEIMSKNLMLEGIMSLQAGDNPRIVQMKLSAFLDPKTRLLLETDEGN
jgi:chemotaxis protein MotA